MIKPRALMRGARLAVLSPASTPKPDRVEAGMQRLRKAGYEPILFPGALTRGPMYFAGSVLQRVADLHNAFHDDSIDGILCTRGGWGSAELLPCLDAELIRTHPKVFIGYSDHTSLHVWMQNVTGLVTFYGPMVAADFARPDGWEQTTWEHALEGSAVWSMGSEQGIRILRPGVAEGTLTGGCLSILAEALGTPYAPRITEGILFLEDIGTKPYQWDRMLLHLRYAGVLDRVRGIIFGDMRQCWPNAAEGDEAFEASVLHALREFAGPVAIGLRSGHVFGANVTLPMGVQVRLDLSNPSSPSLQFLEPSVEG